MKNELKRTIAAPLCITSTMLVMTALIMALLLSLTACGGQPTDASQESVSAVETSVPPVVEEDSVVEDSVEESALEATKSTLTKSEKTAKKADKAEKKTETSAKPSAAPKTEQATAAATPAPTATPKPASSGKTGGSSGYTAPATDKTPSSGSTASKPADTTPSKPSTETKPATTPAPTPVHEHSWVEHYAEKQTLVSDGYWEDVYQSVPVYETVGTVNGIAFNSMAEQNAYVRSLGPDATVEFGSTTVVTGYRDELVDRVWHEPVYTTESYVDYYYCSCGATK